MTSKELKAMLPDDDRLVFLDNTGSHDWYGLLELSYKAVQITSSHIFISLEREDMREEATTDTEDQP